MSLDRNFMIEQFVKRLKKKEQEQFFSVNDETKELFKKVEYLGEFQTIEESKKQNIFKSL